MVGEADRSMMTGSAPAPAESAITVARSITTRLWVGIVVALTVAVGWLLLAVTHPTTTYHFDPFLVVIAPVALTRFRSTGALSWRIVLAGSGIGASMALTTTVLLDGVDALRGPTLVASITPVTETLIAILLGIAIELASTLIRQARDAH